MDTEKRKPAAPSTSQGGVAKAHHPLEELDDVLDYVPVAKSDKNGIISAIVEEELEEEEEGLFDGEGGAEAAKAARANAAHGHRLIRKAKRPRDRAYSTSEEGRFGGGAVQPTVGHHPQRSVKNMRKSRSGLGRGLPKKGDFVNIF